jgi:hypothetical protein
VKLRPHKRRNAPPQRLLACAPLLALLAAAVGCDTMFQRSGGASPTSEHPGSEFDRNSAGSEDGRREVAAYVNFVEVLDNTDEQGWHTIFEHTLAAHQKEPSHETRMRLALVLSRADQKSHEAQVTHNLLTDARDLFAETVHDSAPPALVRKFAQLQVTQLETRLALYEEMRSLRSQLAKAHQESQSAQRDRSEVEARMRHINAALNEANAKLEAVMDIERNIGPAGKETFP